VASIFGFERLASFQPFGGCLQCLQLLVVVALGRENRRVPEQITHLGQRDAALDQPRRVLVPKIVPVQVDAPEPLLCWHSVERSL
jgi:hypothetical protein